MPSHHPFDTLRQLPVDVEHFAGVDVDIDFHIAA
jgi:hypothetical protein